MRWAQDAGRGNEPGKVVLCRLGQTTRYPARILQCKSTESGDGAVVLDFSRIDSGRMPDSLRFAIQDSFSGVLTGG